jgi:hypothetical protein
MSLVSVHRFKDPKFNAMEHYQKIMEQQKSQMKVTPSTMSKKN